MSTSPRSHRDTSQRRRIGWRRLAIVGLIAGIVLASVSCTGPPADKAENSTVISYSGAVSRLRGLEPAEAEEQLRDWARTGLASHLELDTARLRDAAFDTVPVRDLAFADLSRQSTGPGRALFDGHGVLHVLVQRGDPHEARTIGLLIDQYRSDAGADPQQVQLHHYQIHPSTQTIELIPDKPAPTAEVRSAHGFVTMRVDELPRLTDFLARTRHLSWLEVRGSEIWAGGWNWPDALAAPLDVEDVSVIQRGYLQPSAERRPGFSLDPGPPETRDDIGAVLPGLRPDLADRLITDDWKGSTFGSAEHLSAVVDGALFHGTPQPAALAKVGLPSDRTQLWALQRLLAGRPAYSQARNDGRLEGTKVGMTLFYADKVAKDWVTGVGSGVPTKAVGGFTPDPEAVTPWSHCAGAGAPISEYGRLWFGQNDSDFTVGSDRVSIGAQATRLFARSEADGGTEVEPSFGFGRGLRWWDQHYQAVADYEPQYQRLDQIMRWSGALEWLVTKTQAKLPRLDDAAIRSGLRFKDWYAQHDELRERSQIQFVTPPSATHEAIMSEPSRIFEDCGLAGIVGGVSLGDVIQRKGDRSFHADVPEPLRRGGLFDEKSHFDAATGSGRINQVSIDGRGQVVDSLQRTFSTASDGRAVVDVVANGRRVEPFGGLKVWRAETAPRQIKVELAADRGQISENVEFQNQGLGRLVAHKYVDTVTIQWKSGPIDRARRILESLQDRLVARPTAELPPATDGVLYRLDVSGQPRYKIGGPDDPWLTITKDPKPPGDELAFRLGAPHPQTSEPQFFDARLSSRPELPPNGGGPPSWMEVIPAIGDQPAQVRFVGPPGDGGRPVRVTTPDGVTSTAIQVGDRLRARVDDPILGLNGTIEGAALLRGFPRVGGALLAAAQTRDGLLRGVRFGHDGEDGVALAGADGVTLVAADHSWAGRVQQATGSGPSPQVRLFRLEGDRLVHVDPSGLTVLPGSARPTTLGKVISEVRNAASVDVYVHRSMLVFDHGRIVPDALPRARKVIVREAVVTDSPGPEATAMQPDIRIHDGAEWWLLIGAGLGGLASLASTPDPASPGGGAAPAPGRQILLVCPDTGEKLPGCAQ